MRNAAVILALAVTASRGALADAVAEYRTGLPVPTPQGRKWIQENCRRVERVSLNALGTSRLEAARHPARLAGAEAVSATAVPLGSEFATDAATGPALASRTDGAGGGEPLAVPPSVDNSALDAFPPIRSQRDQGSCSAFCTTYYQATHNTALARRWNARSGGDRFRFSPKWTYNMVNRGADAGCEVSDCLQLMRDHGAAFWADFPYTGDLNDYFAWCGSADVWRTAIGFRLNQFFRIDQLYTDAGIQRLKAALADGYVASFATYAPWPRGGWAKGTVGNDPATSEDDALAGQEICAYVLAEDWGHALTIVGYNDHVWCDLNANGRVDSGEKGALKIANSWGASWANSGFAWFAYDALKRVSSVPNGPNPVNRTYGFGYNASGAECEAYVMTARPEYAPTLLARFSLRHSRRGQMTLKVGKAMPGAVAPAVTWEGFGLSGDGGDFPVDGVFYLDMTDLEPEENVTRRYFLGLEDARPDSQRGILNAVALLEGPSGEQIGAVQWADPNLFSPTSGVADGSTAWGILDHPFNSTNTPRTCSVMSWHGQCHPPPGRYAYPYGALFAGAVTNPTITAGATQFVCAAWSGTGSATNGQGTSVSFALRKYSSLQWAWRTNYFVSCRAGAGGAVDVTGRWFARGSTVTVKATPETHYHFTHWSGDTNGCALSGARVLVPGLNAARHLQGNFQIDRHLWSIASAHGGAVPAPGAYTNDYGTRLTCAVTNSPVVSGSTQYVCVGWAGRGCATNGSGTQTSFLLGSDGGIAWIWRTQFVLRAACGLHGSIVSGNGWRDAGSRVTVAAAAHPGFFFERWQGDVPFADRTNNPLAVTMSAPRSLIAHFGLAPPAPWSEPEFTGGPSNAIYWAAMPSASAYEAQISEDAAFTNAASSGWLSGTSHTFTGLAPGRTYYSRVRSRTRLGVVTNRWAQTETAQFALNGNGNVAPDAAGGLRLTGNAVAPLRIFIYAADFTLDGGFVAGLTNQGHSVTVREEFPADPASFDVLIITSGHGTLAPVSASALDAFTARGGGLLILADAFRRGVLSPGAASSPVSAEDGWLKRTAGAAVSNAANPIVAGLPPSTTLGGYSTTPVLKPGADIALRWHDGAAMAATMTNGFGRVVYLNDFWAWSGHTWYGDRPYGEKLMANILRFLAPFWGTTIGETLRPFPFYRWGRVLFRADSPARSGIEVDVLDEAGAVLARNVASGADLSGLGVTTLSARLRARLLSGGGGIRPRLIEWSIEWMETPDAPPTDFWAQAGAADFSANEFDHTAVTGRPGRAVLRAAGVAARSAFVHAVDWTLAPQFQQDLAAIGLGITVGEELPADLSAYDIIVLTGGGGQLPPASAPRIDAFVAAGGGLVILEDALVQDVFPCSSASSPVSAVAGWARRTNAVVVNASSPVAAGLIEEVPLQGYACSPELKAGADVVVRWGDGTPMVVTWANGNGKAIYINNLWTWYYRCWQGAHEFGARLMSNVVGFAFFPPLTGRMVSTAIAPGTFDRWGTLSYSADVARADCSLTVDVLDADGGLLAADVPADAHLPALGIAAPRIRLRANFATRTPGASPSLAGWRVSWVETSSLLLVSGWSPAVRSTQTPQGAVILRIVPAAGRPQPTAGDHLLTPGTQLLFRIYEPVLTDGSTQRLCSGWTRTDTGESGTGTMATLTVSDNCTLSWQWRTNYFVAVGTRGEGAVDFATRWVPRGHPIHMRSTPAPYWHLAAWLGDTNGCRIAGTDLTATSDQGRRIEVRFEQNLTAHGAPEPWLAGYGLTNGSMDAQAAADQDRDGMPAWTEWKAGTDPTNAASALRWISAAGAGGGRLSATFGAASGKVYRVAACEAFPPAPAAWQRAAFARSPGGPMESGSVTGCGARVTIYLDRTPAQRFYSIGVE